MGVLVLLIRGTLLPFWPIPKPVIYDEFSYLLQADTFAHGRLTNPTHKLWQFFESAYLLQHPTYASKYPPAQSLTTAAGQVLFGHPWFGVWLSCGIMMAALVWAMQGWLPSRWALVGGFLALPVAVSSYWMNSYWGGAVAATGGALVLGAYARVVRARHDWYALAMGFGLVILANTRPYEGLVFCVPVAIALFLAPSRWAAIALIGVVLIPGAAATGYYNQTVTGSAFQMPFTEYARQYVHIPLFNFQPLQPSKVYRTYVMYDLHQNWERAEWEKARSWRLVRIRLKDWSRSTATILGSAFAGWLIILFLPVLWHDRRIRLPLMCVAAVFAGSWIEIRYYEHYAAPATVALLILAVQSLRHLRQWRRGGRFLAWAIPVLIVGAVAVAQGRKLVHSDPQPANALRDDVAQMLIHQGGKHVILVDYTGNQSPHEEWVYNNADIDAQPVIWAHDLGVEEDAQLAAYYKDRKIWRLQPDKDPASLQPVSAPRP